MTDSGGQDSNCDGQVDQDYGGGLGTVPELVSGSLLAAWMGVSAWRRRRQLER
jgi:hypothetical protein